MSEWQPIEIAPKGKKSDGWFGPRILIYTKHHGQECVFIGRFHHGVHQRFLDESDHSCVSAGSPGDFWMPLPSPPASLGPDQTTA